MALKAGRVGVNPNYVDKEGRPLYDNSYLKELLRREGIITLFTKEGNPISIDNAVEGHLYSCIVTVSPKQAGTGTPSPTNVRAITGYDTLKITANSVDTDYSFDSTVYGGVLDVSSGVLTIDKVGVDMGDLIWTYQDTAGRFYIDLTDLLPATSDSIAFLGIASNCKIVAANRRDAETDPILFVFGGQNRVYSKNFTDTSVEAFQATMDGQILCYELATPTTVQLTPAQIALVTGSNTVTSTTGTSLDIQYLGTLVPGGANGRSLNRSLNLNREVIDGEARKEIQEAIKEVPVEEPVTVKKSSKKSTK